MTESVSMAAVVRLCPTKCDDIDSLVDNLLATYAEVTLSNEAVPKFGPGSRIARCWLNVNDMIAGAVPDNEYIFYKESEIETQ